MKRVLLTGAAGGVGSALRKYAAGRYDFVFLDRVPTPGEPGALVGELEDLESLKNAAAGCEAMVHLGGCPGDKDFMSVLLPSNIIGGYHAFEAARRAGVKRMVFASTLQVDNGWREQRPLKPGLPRFPTNLYGVTKCFGEDLGRVYSSNFGLSVICLRFGWVAVDGKRDRMINKETGQPTRIAVTVLDCCEVICRSIDVEGVSYEVLPVFSRNGASAYDLSPLKAVLGYEPQDDALEMHQKGEFI
jgi:nucleoside-diphosphate-sugar epimerase